MRRIALAVAALAVAASLALPAPDARAGEDDPLRWLMNEPITMFDLGLMRLDGDAVAAAERVVPRNVALGPPRAGAYYLGRERTILVYVAVNEVPAMRTRENCSALFRQVVDEITRFAPDGSGRAGRYLEQVFVPMARAWARPGPDFGSRLAEMVELRVTLAPPHHESLAGPAERVSCFGRLDAADGQLAYRVGS